MADISQGIHGALRQAFLGSVVVSTVTSIGFNLAWPVLLPIGNNTGIEDLSFSQLDMQWLVSVRSLSGCLAPFLAGVLMEATGPTRQLLLCFLLTNLLWILMAIFPSKLILYAGRTALGVTVSMIGTIAITLTTELLPPGLRGVFGTLQRVASSIGILCVYVMASFLNWRWGTALCGVLAIPVAVLLFFVPEVYPCVSLKGSLYV